jgi:CrtC N-terminal lipocalin domain
VWSLTAPAAGDLSSLPPPAPPPQGALQLRLVPEQPYVPHGTLGIIRQGPAPSAYYSAPRLAVSGTLVAGGRRLAVQGQGWFDHQWGNFATDQSSLHWNWFACQLDDGRNLMLYLGGGGDDHERAARELHRRVDASDPGVEFRLPARATVRVGSKAEPEVWLISDLTREVSSL